MSTRVGLELTPTRIRAVTVRGLRGSPVDTFEIKWDPTVPRDAVKVLREYLGQVGAIGVAVGLGFAHVKHVPLPPVFEEQRRAILTLEPDRFFAIEGGEIVAATRRDSDLVFAADAPLVDSWVTELEKWATVASVEPAPAALTRVLRPAGAPDGAYRADAAEGEVGLIEISEGSLRTARRVPESEPVGDLREAPAVKDVPPEFVTAYGAALGVNSPIGEMLVTSAIARRMHRRRRMSVARSAVNVLLALAFAVAAVDRYRSRVLEREDAEIAELTPKAAGGAALQSRLAKLDVQSSVAGERGLRADPVSVLAALTRRLPRDASVISVRADGDTWQIDGTARDAGGIVPALDADPQLDDVRALSGTSRFTENGRTYETFSVGLRAHR